MNLEDFFKKWFGVKHPFLAHPKKRKDGGTEYLTSKGYVAYRKMMDLLGDLSELGIIPSGEKALDIVDDIISGH